ncbi:virion core protein, T7 gp14 family [Rickettsiella endosymbiont of Dermanyssus gallinae]|uniref:virion core protein, T7 gp14 family n=1 Tax=Rickettsiella endosymbiont of Dermanyssus gallinae TaxID=2856608 RepID=UPI001C52F1B5|nr:hypothetical protein [Rickettsiella endosymbiont of Dermanyssus gallinae]
MGFAATGAGLIAASSIYSASQDSIFNAEQTTAQNKAIAEYNKSIALQSMKAFTQQQLQFNANKQAIQGSLFNIQAQGAQDKSQINAGAGDNIGASVKDAVATVSTAESLLTGKQKNSLDQMLTISNMQLDQIADQAKFNMRDAVMGNYRGILNKGIWEGIGKAVGMSLQSAKLV